MNLIVRDRLTGKIEREQVYGQAALRFLYGDDLVTKLFGRPLLAPLCKTPFFSAFYGWLQKRPASKKKVLPFIRKYGVDTSEFEKEVASFESFNDFFIRKLKPEARPIASDDEVATIPADGRFLAFPNIDKADGFMVKGNKFDLTELLQNETLASRYSQGAMVIGRLCPTDYHRFHFPCDGMPSEPELINGWLYSVNPIALKKNCRIFTQNKRCYTLIETKCFGTVLMMEVGATNVGTIIQTYQPLQDYRRGDEKGYFSFGGSALILLFEPGSITLDDDLLQTGNDKIELKCQMGQSLGTANL